MGNHNLLCRLSALLFFLISVLFGSRVGGESWCLVYMPYREDNTRSYVVLIIFIFLFLFLYSKINTGTFQFSNYG